MMYKGNNCTECGKKLTKEQKKYGLNVCSSKCEDKFEKNFKNDKDEILE